MVSELLNALIEKKTFSQFELADRLRITPEAVVAGLAFLEHRGFIKKAVPPSCCERHCYGCNGCGFARKQPVIWEIKRS
jgi:predicted ArsR family transcriptional regulator